MVSLCRTFISVRLLVKGAAAALLLLCSIPHDVAASPISVLDRTVAPSARPLPDQARRLPTSPVVVSGSIPSLPIQAEASDDSAPAAGPALAPLGWSGEGTPDKPLSGETLRDVLRSMVTWHATDETHAAAARRAAQGGFYPMSGGDDGELGVDLRKLILDSEIGGAVLRAIVDIKSADKNGATFSIFGLGNFALDYAPDLHSAIVSELSSGMAFRMSLSGDRLGYDGYPGSTVGTNPAATTHENVNLVRVIWNWLIDFIYSPVGALLSMGVAITGLLWICVKSVVFLQRRASRFSR
jgi:hypothetical protein